MIARALRRFARDQRGTTAMEFVLAMPLLILVIFGVMDVGGYAWQMNLNAKSVQFGTRVAVVTDSVVDGLATTEYVGKTIGGTTLTQGDLIPAAALTKVTCTSASCSCTTGELASCGLVSAAFNRIVARMSGINGIVKAANVTVEYRGSGLGYAGDPGGAQIAPLTTVTLSGVSYKPIMGLIFGTQAVTMPTYSYTLTMEDGAGTVSN